MMAKTLQTSPAPASRPQAPHVAAAVGGRGVPSAIQRMEVDEDYETWVVDTKLKIAVRDDSGFLARASHLRSLGYTIWEGNFWQLSQQYPFINLRQTLSGEFTLEETREMEELHKTHRSGGGALKWTGGETKSVLFEGSKVEGSKVEGGPPQEWATGEEEYRKLLFVSSRDEPRRTGITEGWTYVGESASRAQTNLGSFTIFDSNALGFKSESLTSTGRVDPSAGPGLPYCAPQKGGRRVLTWNDIRRFRGGTRSTEGGKHTQAMNNVSAGVAAAAAGYIDIKEIGDPFSSSSTKKANYQWLHLIAYGLGGLDGSNPDHADNLVVGTSMTNGFMELVESLIAEALEAGAMLGLVVDVAMIDTDYHIPGNIIYTVWNAKDESKFITYEFEPMSTWPSYSGDKRFTREFFRASLGL